MEDYNYLHQSWLTHYGVKKILVHYSKSLIFPLQIASRCLSTVHNTLVELSLLGATAVEGAAACWAQLACAETLRACERLAASNNALDMCTATQAPLLHNAKDKVSSHMCQQYSSGAILTGCHRRRRYRFLGAARI